MTHHAVNLADTQAALTEQSKTPAYKAGQKWVEGEIDKELKEGKTLAQTAILVLNFVPTEWAAFCQGCDEQIKTMREANKDRLGEVAKAVKNIQNRRSEFKRLRERVLRAEHLTNVNGEKITLELVMAHLTSGGGWLGLWNNVVAIKKEAANDEQTESKPVPTTTGTNKSATAQSSNVSVSQDNQQATKTDSAVRIVDESRSPSDILMDAVLKMSYDQTVEFIEQLAGRVALKGGKGADFASLVLMAVEDYRNPKLVTVDQKKTQRVA